MECVYAFNVITAVIIDLDSQSILGVMTSCDIYLGSRKPFVVLLFDCSEKVLSTHVYNNCLQSLKYCQCFSLPQFRKMNTDDLLAHFLTRVCVRNQTLVN